MGKIEKWEAKDGTLFGSEVEANDHDKNIQCSNEIVKVVQKHVSKHYNTMISEFINEHHEEIYKVLSKKFNRKANRKFGFKLSIGMEDKNEEPELDTVWVD